MMLQGFSYPLTQMQDSYLYKEGSFVISSAKTVPIIYKVIMLS